MRPDGLAGRRGAGVLVSEIRGFLAHKTTPTHLGLPQDPRHRPTVGSQGGGGSYIAIPQHVVFVEEAFRH